MSGYKQAYLGFIFHRKSTLCWNSEQMITEGDAAIQLETTLHAFHNQEKTKQRSTIVTEATDVIIAI